MKTLRELFGEKKFAIGVELVTSRGISRLSGQKVAQLTEDLCRDDRLDWISFTDNAGGNPMMSPDHMGRKVQGFGKNAVINMTCKDRNRNALESAAWQYASEGLDNIMALSGDYPFDGYRNIAMPVFDMDSVGLIMLLKEMNNGLVTKGRKPGTTVTLDKTNFFIGCTVSPFKHSEAEQMMQYEKLKMKVQNGADFIIPQLGYDIRKSHELLCYMKENNITLPVVGNIYRLTAGIARMFNENMFPGCVVSDALLERINKEKNSEDKGRRFFTEFAAKQLACFRGMGYSGAYIAGIDKPEDFASILEKAEEYKNANWLDFVPELTNPRPKEFYCYVKDEKTGLSDATKKNPDYIHFKKSGFSKHVSLAYRFSRALHSLVFDYNAPFFGIHRGFYKLYEKKSWQWLSRLSYLNERMSKALLFNCRECGDCSLPDITYLCPESQCAKNQRNGPCGGSLSDTCEVQRFGKYCIWVKAYSRQKYFHGNSKKLLDRKPVIKNNELYRTSGWANCFLLKDHNAYKKKKK